MTVAILAAIASLLIGVNDANAGGWGCYGVSAGCYGASPGCYGVSAGCYGVSAGCYGVSAGCYGGAAVSCYGSDGCYGGRVGPIRRLAARMHARREACSCYGDCFGGCYGSSCYGSSCFGGCYGGCYGSNGCGGSTVIYDSAPVQYDVQEVQPTPAIDSEPEAPTPVEGAQLSRGTAVLAVDVPADAKIYVNGSETSTEGSHRLYMSTGLISGRAYPYKVRAVVDRGGKQRAITKFVSLAAGSEAKISFEFADDEQPETVLTLYVPAEAKVNLANADTEQTGSQRVFTTARLEPGQVWDDYRVRVTLDRSGQKITKEKTVKLRGGEAHELRFDFNESFVASK